MSRPLGTFWWNENISQTRTISFEPSPLFNIEDERDLAFVELLVMKNPQYTADCRYCRLKRNHSSWILYRKGLYGFIGKLTG